MSAYRITHYLGWPLLGLLCALPAYQWSTLQPIATRADGPVTVMLSLGQLLGIIGLTLFAFNLLLTTRIKLFEDLFGGLNKVFFAHHIIGTIAFLALLAHPVFLALRLVPSSLREAALLLVPRLDNIPVALGILALLGLIGLMFITFYVPLNYRTWLLTHKYLGGVFFLAGLHVLLTPNDLSNDRPLQVYLLGLSFLGIVSYSYRTLFPGIFVKRYDYVVQLAKKLNENTVEVDMMPVRKGIRFEAGQFIFVSFRVAGMSPEWHPFTVSSAPNDVGLAITVKSLGKYTETLTRILPNAQNIPVKVEGAYGRFEFKDVGGPSQIWVAGGIGITPFLSLARSLAASESQFLVDLYYSVKSESELVDMDKLQEAVMSLPDRTFRVIPFIADKQGFLTAKYINENSGGLAGKDILLCGPPPMMIAMKKQFAALGVHKANVHTEEFSMS
jgi:predicted ferric reductase